VSNKIPYDRRQPYNKLPLLPPPDSKILTIKVLMALNKANRALAELKGLAQKLPNQSMLINTLALREAKASTEIENIFTTDDELYKALSEELKNVSALKGGAKEVLHYREALWRGYAHLKKQNAFSQSVLIDVYQQVQQTSDGIRPPQTETVIKKRGSGNLGGTVIYTPPRGQKLIEGLLKNLFLYLNDDKKYDHDPLIKLAVAHYQLEAIHPFRDGNGRCGRIVNSLLLVQKRLLEVPILYLSAYIINNKDDYYFCLNGVTTRSDWQSWLLYMLKAVEETSVYTIQLIKDIDSLFKNTAELVSKRLPHVPQEVLEKIFEQPYISPKRLMSARIKSLNTAKKYLQQMEKLRIMLPKKVGKEVIYLNVDLFNLLSEA
jgi:Fic family protein